MKKLLVIIFVFFVAIQTTKAQYLYGIVADNTNEAIIGKSCELDMVHLAATLNTIAKSIGLTPRIKVISRSNFMFENVQKEIDQLQCTDQDIVFFYYSGHGENPAGSAYPALLFGDGKYKLEILHTQLKQKGARLCISIGDCCNTINTQSVQNRGFIVVPSDKDSLNNYRNLFLVPEGDIIVSASSKGQAANGNDEIGGYFTHEFLIALNCAVNYSTELSWNTILNDTRTRLNKYTFKAGKQVPFYQTRIKKGFVPKPISVVSYEEINKYFSDLMQTNSEQKNLREAYQTYFEKNARVDIYVETLLTDVMTIENFLDRLMLHSEKIVSLNLIQNLSKLNSHGDKYKQITVQEWWLRTK